MSYEYLIWCPDYGQEEKDARKVSATDAYTAARLWGERSDREGSDYLIANGEAAEVSVLTAYGIERFTVSAEQEIRYSAKAKAKAKAIGDVF